MNSTFNMNQAVKRLEEQFNKTLSISTGGDALGGRGRGAKKKKFQERAIVHPYVEESCVSIILYTRYTPVIHLYSRICTYVHPLYMYIQPYTPYTHL